MTPVPIRPLSKPERVAAPRQIRPRRGARWVKRMFYRYQPAAILALFAALVLVPLVLDLFVPPVRDWIDGQAHHHEVGVNLLEHVLVAALVAAAAFYWVLGRKRQRALRIYRSVALEAPGELVEWWQGHKRVTPRAMSGLLADGIERSREPALAIVQGRTGAGRTSFVVGLVNELADRSLIPIPVLAQRDGTLAFDAAARDTFCRYAGSALSSDREADEIWHRARSTRDVVILVDGLDDELVGQLRDNRSQLQTTISGLQRQCFSIVLAATAELPLDCSPLREDLDLFSREEAERYVEDQLGHGPGVKEVVDALDRVRHPVDGFRIAPAYLDLLVRLQEADLSLPPLPAHRDRWRAVVIGAYLQGITAGRIKPPANAGDADSSEYRGRAAKKAAQAVARTLGTERTDLAVSLKRVKIGSRALRDAVDLNLLWHGAERVGFAADDIGAYLVAATLTDVGKLLGDVERIAAGGQPSEWRRDRHVLSALVFWHLRHPAQAGTGLKTLLTAIEDHGWTRPVIVATAVRIASGCELDGSGPRIAAAANRCIDSLGTQGAGGAKTWRATELPRLVRALADWPCPHGHQLLWRLATYRDVEVEWPAAKALALARGTPWETLRPIVESCLATAAARPAAQLSRPDDALGNQIGSLAWILPSLRGTDAQAEERFKAVARICLAQEMSPLRGEMSLAQGLRLAVVEGKCPAVNIADVRDLVFGPGCRVRFWHARLVLVQAVLAHAWQHDGEIGELDAQLAELESREPHALVKRAIVLARHGLRDARRPPKDRYPLSRYMWLHEREAVRWVEQGKAEVAQLAGDVVLLSNMTYRLRRSDPAKADEVAALADLPRCVSSSADRERITTGCGCDQGLCDGDGDQPAVSATRAQFSESFCREQARLVAQVGRPPWVRRAPRMRKRLQDFWDGQAVLARNGGSAARPG